MTKILALAAVVCALGFAQAQAETMDVSTIKCSELSKMSKDDLSYVLFWMHGYYGGKNEDTTIDFDGLTKTGEALGKKCAANGDLGMLTVMGQIINDK